MYIEKCSISEVSLIFNLLNTCSIAQRFGPLEIIKLSNYAAGLDFFVVACEILISASNKLMIINASFLCETSNTMC